MSNKPDWARNTWKPEAETYTHKEIMYCEECSVSYENHVGITPVHDFKPHKENMFTKLKKEHEKSSNLGMTWKESPLVPDGIVYLINPEDRILNEESYGNMPKTIEVTRFKTTGKWYEDMVVILPPYLTNLPPHHDFEIQTYLRELRKLNKDEMLWLVETQPPQLITD